MNNITDSKNALYKYKIHFFISSLLKGIGQIMLQESERTGIFLLLGILLSSFKMFIAALFAVCTATLFAYCMKYDKNNIYKGLYGFNAALVGVALLIFFKSSLVIWILICSGAILTALLQHRLMSYRISFYTLPFVLITWIIVFIFQNIYPLASCINDNIKFFVDFPFDYLFKGYGQVIFQEYTLAGIIFFLAVSIHSPVGSIIALSAGLVSSYIAFYMAMPLTIIESGLFSYNAVLCALVYSGKRIRDGFKILISVFLSITISVIMFELNIIMLTFPFVLATIITDRLKSTSNMFQSSLNT